MSNTIDLDDLGALLDGDDTDTNNEPESAVIYGSKPVYPTHEPTPLGDMSILDALDETPTNIEDTVSASSPDLDALLSGEDEVIVTQQQEVEVVEHATPTPTPTPTPVETVTIETAVPVALDEQEALESLPVEHVEPEIAPVVELDPEIVSSPDTEESDDDPEVDVSDHTEEPEEDTVTTRRTARSKSQIFSWADVEAILSFIDSYNEGTEAQRAGMNAVLGWGVEYEPSALDVAHSLYELDGGIEAYRLFSNLANKLADGGLSFGDGVRFSSELADTDVEIVRHFTRIVSVFGTEDIKYRKNMAIVDVIELVVRSLDNEAGREKMHSIVPWVDELMESWPGER